jgi:hypothetical protein
MLDISHLRFVHLNNTSSALVPLVPVVVERICVQWQYNVVRDQIASGQRDAEPTHQCHAKDPSVKSEYRELDDAHAPRVDEYVRKCDLCTVLAGRPLRV